MDVRVTQTPEFPGHETHVDKAVAAGVLDDVSERYVAWAAERIADGAPVIAEVADDA